MAAGKQPYRILYMHGLESGAWGNKAMLLKKSFRTVKSVDMKVSLLNLSKDNSLARCVLASKEFHSLLAVSIVTFLSILAVSGSLLLSCTASLGILGSLGYVYAVPVGAQTMMSSATAIQKTALKEFQPDLVVASSFGGAVACQLIRQGLWDGPTLLLAPAYNEMMRRFPSVYQGMEFAHVAVTISKMKIVHAIADDTVPVADSRTLQSYFGEENAELVELTYDGHRLSEYANARLVQDCCELLGVS